LIGRLSGRLVAKNPPQVLLEVAGVGYEVEVPMSTFFGLPATGDGVTLHTHLVVREDAHILYGFATLQERAAFRKLIRIPAGAPRWCCRGSVAELAQAVTLQDSAPDQGPGIGKKTAERLLERKASLPIRCRRYKTATNDVLNAPDQAGLWRRRHARSRACRQVWRSQRASAPAEGSGKIIEWL
jgi:Holliday junction DNA helicase RuvA